MTKTYGETLRERRKAKGITIVELAEQTGISQADLVRAELVQKTLSPKQMKKVEELIA